MSKKALFFNPESSVLRPVAPDVFFYGGAPVQPSTFNGPGSLGSAPITSFFGLVPDQFTLLAPGHYGSSSLGFDNITPARYPSQYTIYNTAFDGGANQNSVSLGAFTTAPDGTTNVAQKLVESNANSVHYIGALHGHSHYFNTQFGLGPVFRIGVFAKAAERSRLCIKIINSSTAGASIVFDLAGVRVGVAATASTGNLWGLVGTPSIYSFGGGWCCCWFDVQTGDITATSPFYIVKLMLDANTGTQGENTSYAGDGTSGLYVWSTVMLPPKAWAINNTSFFDDFDTGLPTVDVNKTYVPGFNWYLTQGFSPPTRGLDVPNPGFFASTPSANVTQVNPSTVRLLQGSGTIFGGLTASIATFYGDSTLLPFPQGYVGRWFQPPYVQEIKYKDNPSGYGGNGLLGSWSLELITNPGATALTQQARPPREGEMEWTENQGGSPIPGATPTWYWASSSSSIQDDNLTPFSCLPAPLKWVAQFAFPQFSIVSYLGNLYQNASGQSTVGNNPVTNSPAEWTAYNGTNPDTTVFSSNFSANYQALTPYDPADFHTYTGIWLPGEDTANGIGWMGLFVDGVCFGVPRITGSFSAASILTYYGGLPAPAFDTWRIMEGAHWPIFLSRGSNANQTVDFDYVKVLQ